MTDRASASNKATTGHSCCDGEKAQDQAPKNVAAEVKSAGGCCGGDNVPALSATVAEDPVCGMTVSPATAETSSFQGKNFFFCSSGCHKKFDASPATFLGKVHQPMERHHG